MRTKTVEVLIEQEDNTEKLPLHTLPRATPDFLKNFVLAVTDDFA